MMTSIVLLAGKVTQDYFQDGMDNHTHLFPWYDLWQGKQ
jgi:hypothetical protein